MKMTIGIEPKPAPRPCPRPRFGRRAYMPKEYQKYKEAVGLAVKSKCKTPLTENLKMAITFRRKLDACNGIVFLDDSQVVSLMAEKAESAEVGIDIDIDKI